MWSVAPLGLLVVAWTSPRAPTMRCAMQTGASATRGASPCRSPVMSENVPLEALNPTPVLEVREVISSVMAALHRSNQDAPKELYGFEVAMRFLAPTHAAKLRGAKPGGFARYLRQPHKVGQINWGEYRYEGDTVYLTSDAGVAEAYQMCSMRPSPSSKWVSTRWKLVQVEADYGETVTRPQWMVEAVYSGEPDTPEDIEFLRTHQVEGAKTGGEAAVESPRRVVMDVMSALRNMNEPYALHGAVVATRYCSPRNRASELSPEVFAKYLDDPWYSVLTEWDAMEDDDEEFMLDDYLRGSAEVEVLVKREGDEEFTMVSWDLALFDGQWLINSLNIIS